MKTLADVTQAITAATLTALVLWAIAGLFRKPTTTTAIVGSSASFAAAAGGAKEGPMVDEPNIQRARA